MKLQAASAMELAVELYSRLAQQGKEKHLPDVADIAIDLGATQDQLQALGREISAGDQLAGRKKGR